MSYDEAQELQNSIYAHYPLLPVSIKTLGSIPRVEYVCIIETSNHPYYLWDMSDWLQYEQAQGKRLLQYDGTSQDKNRYRQEHMRV